MTKKNIKIAKFDRNKSAKIARFSNKNVKTAKNDYNKIAEMPDLGTKK